MRKLENKVALITGSSKGIGRAIALKFAQEGANVAINFKSSYQEAQDVLAEVIKIGVKGITVSADITKEDESKRLVETVINELGNLDILVNNAGGYIEGDEWNGEEKVWLDTFKTNTISVLNTSKYALDYFLKHKKGIIINIATRYSVSGQYDTLAYSAAKAGIVNVTQSQAKLLLPYGRANAISPGAARSGYWQTASKSELGEAINQIPTKKLIEPEEIAELALYLSSDISKNITGQNILIDGGYTLLN